MICQNWHFTVAKFGSKYSCQIWQLCEVAKNGSFIKLPKLAKFGFTNFCQDWSLNIPQSGQPKHICFPWNDSIAPTCSFPNCKFQHICYICACDPAITKVSHKAIHCPQRRPVQQSIKLLFPAHDTPKSSAFSCI